MVYSTKVHISATWTVLIYLYVLVHRHITLVYKYINIAAMCLVCGHFDWDGIYRWGSGIL